VRIIVFQAENIVLEGNQITRVSSEILVEMKYVKKVDLRLNQLTLPSTETLKFSVLEHLTHLDIRDNRVTELDLRSVLSL
jgi:PH domain/leucine-rich repeat-containing protein phosphatase